MYTLRLINKETKVERNVSLGKSYALSQRVFSKVHFDEVIKTSKFGNEDEMYGVIMDDQHAWIPLYNQDTAFIMTERGSTLEKLN